MAQLKEKVPEHPDLPAPLSEIGRARPEKMEVDGSIRTVATVTVCPKAQGKTDAHDPKLGENAHLANPQHEVVGASEAKKPPKINACESAAVKSILRRSNTCLDTSVPFHYMLRVLRSRLNAATSLQVEPCSSQHDVSNVGPVLEQTNLSECASAAVFHPPLTSNPTLNNTSLVVEEKLHGLPQVVEVEPQSSSKLPEPSTASDSRGVERPTGGSAEGEGLPPEDLFEDDVDLEGKALDAHRARGHFPFMRECVECRECKGMIPARSRRSKAAEEHLGVAADFVFFGRFVRIALFLALGTGMICAFRVEKSEAFNITQTVLAFKELGGTGRSVEFLSDCDDYLIKLVREASKRETFGSKGVNFRPAPVGRPQYKGRIERMVRTFKEGVNVNWVQLEKALEAKISYEAPLMSHMVRYVSRCQNIHNKMSDSGMSPLDRLREKCESPVPVTWPFGVIGFAKPCHPQRLPYRGKRLVSSVYLGACASVGSGCLC